MKLIVENVQTKAVIGGKDLLLDIDIMEELQKYLRVRPDGYHHSTAYKKRQWDGWRRFITKDGRFATGFLPMVAKFAQDLGVQVDIEDNRGDLPKMKPVEDMTNYIGYIDGKDWIAEGKFEYQFEMVKKLHNTINLSNADLYFPRGILDCATNAGKTSMVALILNNLDRNYNTIFMVSNKLIFQQAVEFFSQVIGEPVGEVKSGKYAPKWFTVCMVKTLYNRAKESMNVRKWLKDTEVLIVDESDEAGATEYSKVLSYIGAGMRVFVSGTPLEASKVNNMVAVGLSGKVLGRITNKELIDKGVSQKPKITMLLNNSGKNALIGYADEVDRNIHLSEIRADAICKIIEEHSDKNILITFIEKKHGYFMFNYCKDRLPMIDMDIVHGTSASRDYSIDAFKKNRISVLFSSMILKRGANIPNIQVLVLAQAGKSIITGKQVIGRALRHDGQSDDVLIYDLYDVGKYVSKHSDQRIKLYLNEEFDLTFDYENKKGKPIL